MKTPKTKSALRKACSAPPAGSTFDTYAQAALSGLLANSAVQTAIGMQAYLNNQEDRIPRTIVEAAMGYATLAVKRRDELLLNEKALP